jgi:hypothetical protein
MRGKYLAVALVLGSVLAGCAGTYSYGYVGYGPPPPVAYGVVGVAPAAGFVWVDGYHVWRGGRYVWVPGRWVRPPRCGSVRSGGMKVTAGASVTGAGGSTRVKKSI